MLAFDLYKDLIDVEGFAVASMFSLEAPGVKFTELDAPGANRFSGYCDASLNQ